MKLAYWSFLIFVILKQFYFFESGGLQPGDLLLLLSLILFIFSKENRLEFNIKVIDRLLIYFIVCVILINGFYAVYYQRIDFVISSLHYVFNFIVVILFRVYAENMFFLEKLFNVCKLNLWIQLLIYLVGIGDYYGTSRYIGTFNDPNQMAFFIYITLMVMYIVSRIINKKISVVYYLIVIFLIFQTVSTGLFLAIFSFVLLLMIYKISSIMEFKFKVKTILKFSFTLIVLLLIASVNIININEYFTDSFLFQRVEEKILKLGNTNSSNSYNELTIVEERGIDKLFLYPERLIWGAGQGYYNRFDEAAHNGEVHSTLLSVLFYYGIIPFILLILWFIKNIGRVTFFTVLIFIPLLLESFTLLNQRQPLFWMVFVLTYIYIQKRLRRSYDLSLP
ncbi:hypothetical protein ACIQYS_09055 [Psychrobacillus sp. NPDC096426]|uniref:hypothetical protein n=1 Tax=Psychrobacillus sp. NPDC096426 TaxID=3364491 RepID=UPI0037F5281A